LSTLFWCALDTWATPVWQHVTTFWILVVCVVEIADWQFFITLGIFVDLVARHTDFVTKVCWVICLGGTRFGAIIGWTRDTFAKIVNLLALFVGNFWALVLASARDSDVFAAQANIVVNVLLAVPAKALFLTRHTRHITVWFRHLERALRARRRFNVKIWHTTHLGWRAMNHIDVDATKSIFKLVGKQPRVVYQAEIPVWKFV